MQTTKKSDKKGKISFGEEFANCNYSIEKITGESFRVIFNRVRGKGYQEKADLFRLYSYYQDQFNKSNQKILEEKFEYFLKRIQVENDLMAEDLTNLSKKQTTKTRFEFVSDKQYPVLFISPEKRIAFANKTAVDFLGREIYWIDNFQNLKHSNDKTKISIDDYKLIYKKLLKNNKIQPTKKDNKDSRRVLESKVLDEKRYDDPSIGLEFNFSLPYSSLIKKDGLDVWACSIANYDPDGGNFLGSMVLFNFNQSNATH